MGQENKHWTNESDIGSGEKSPAQRDLEREQSEIRNSADNRNEAPSYEWQTLQSGQHLARIATRAQDDGTYEAQVYVRLAREPEIAETYIPVGIFATEAEARAAAEERARRALDDEEF